MFKYKVPYNGDFQGFRDLVLPLHSEHIDSLYMGPPALLGSSARPMNKPVTMNDLVQVAELCNSYDIKLYVTLNGEFTPLTTYTSEYASRMASIFKALNGKIQGIILGNMYLPGIAQLREHAPSIKWIASVNSLIFDVQRAKSFIDVVGVDGFVWDRSLNLNPSKLREMNAAIKERYPEVMTQVMVNEGCILHCPFKKAHDQAISALTYCDDDYYDYLKTIGMKNPEMCNAAGYVNVKYGCRAAIGKGKASIATIPDIVPAKVQEFEGCADILKISGRTQPTSWILNCLSNYIEGTATDNMDYSDSGLKKIYKGVE